MDEMETINLHKSCNKKARKAPRPKKAGKSLEPTDDSSEEEQSPKKASRSIDGKKITTKAGGKS